MPKEHDKAWRIYPTQASIHEEWPGAQDNHHLGDKSQIHNLTHITIEVVSLTRKNS